MKKKLRVRTGLLENRKGFRLTGPSQVMARRRLQVSIPIAGIGSEAAAEGFYGPEHGRHEQAIGTV